MKEFCNKIKIIPVGNVISVSGNNVVLKDGKTFDTITADPFFIEAKPNVQDAGLSWSIDQTIITEKVSEAIVLKYPITRSVIAIVEKTDGSITVLGTLDYPVQVTLTVGLQTDQLIISLKTTDRPIF